METPQFSLADVQAAVGAGQFVLHVERCDAMLARHIADPAARRAFLQAAIATLAATDFYRRVDDDNIKYDAYGKVLPVSVLSPFGLQEKKEWYIGVKTSKTGAVIVSFHRPVRRIVLANGAILAMR